ncbi:MAG: hypothetical protein ACYDB7_08870 [Mycobacteriales bacterium]
MVGGDWATSYGDHSAKIHRVNRCLKAGCAAVPYIQTNSDSTKVDNLENLTEK